MIEFDDEPDQEKRIEKLHEEVEKLGGSFSENPDMPADLEEEFLKHVLAYENASAEESTLLQWLENADLEVPPPESLDDEKLHAKLWEVVTRMASLGAYLHNTNHLNDRELYEMLYHDCLREQAVLFPENPSYVYGIDLVSSGSDEDTLLWMKYYADEDTRTHWLKSFPDYEMPAHEAALRPGRIKRAVLIARCPPAYRRGARPFVALRYSTLKKFVP